NAYYAGETGVKYAGGDLLTELYGMLKAHVAPVASKRYALSSSGLGGVSLDSMEALASVTGRAASHMPETAFLAVRGAGGGLRYFTLLDNSAHSNVAELLREQKRRLPDEDTLSVLNGFVGAYPNAFFLVDEKDLAGFVQAVRRLSSEKDFGALLARYGVRPT